MKLALFSQELTNNHIEKLKTFFNKPLSEVRFLFITTPASYKPFKPQWIYRCENQWREVFPKFQEFDLKHAFETEPAFDFKSFYSNCDFMFVSGGNLYILSYWMSKTNSDKYITDLVRANNIVYGGESAGAIYAFKDIEPYQELGEPEKAISVNNNGMDLLKFAPVPHWENPEYQAELKNIKTLLEKKGYSTVTMIDNEACFVIDDKWEIA